MAGRQDPKPFRLKSLKGWKVAWRSMKDAYGLCEQKTQTIYLNPELLSDYKLLIGTASHEGSHAVDDMLSELKAELSGNFAAEIAERFKDYTED